MANREIPIQKLLKIGQQWRTTCDIATYLMNRKYESLEKTLEKYDYFYKELKPQYIDYQNKLDSKISKLDLSIQELTKRINQLEIDEQNILNQVPPGSTEEITTNIIRLNQRLQEKLDKLRKLNELKYELSQMINTINGYERIFINRLNFIEPIEKFKKLIENTKKTYPKIKDKTNLILYLIFKYKPLELLPQDLKTYIIATESYNINNNLLYIDIFSIIQKVRGEREGSEESKGDIEEKESKDEESKDEESKDEYIKRRFLEEINKKINKNTKKNYIISLIRTLLDLNFITNEIDLKNLIKTYYKKTNTILSLPYNNSKLNEEINKFYEFIIRDYNFDENIYNFGIQTGIHDYIISERDLDDTMLFNYYDGISQGISLNVLTEFIENQYNIENGFINKTDVDEECKEYVISKEPETLDAIVSPDFGRDVGEIRTPSIASYGHIEAIDLTDFVPDSLVSRAEEVGRTDETDGASEIPVERELDFDGAGGAGEVPVERELDFGVEPIPVEDEDDINRKKYYKKYLKYKNKYLLLRSKSN